MAWGEIGDMAAMGLPFLGQRGGRSAGVARWEQEEHVGHKGPVVEALNWKIVANLDGQG